MANPRIEKTNAEISRAEARLAESTAKTAEYTAKLRELRQHKTTLENEEIIALFRREKFSEDEFKALLRSQRKEETSDAEESSAAQAQDAANDYSEDFDTNETVFLNEGDDTDA
jgi:hypothetical protein